MRTYIDDRNRPEGWPSGRRNEANAPRGGWKRDSFAPASSFGATYFGSPHIDQRSSEQGRSGRSQQELHRMSWRAEGAQDYPGGALGRLVELSYRGRGPKNYRRSDERLREIICEQLTEDPFIDAVDISVDVADCEVTLSGTVSSRTQKLRIEDAVADVVGVTEIHNMLAIRTDEIENR
jgi:hypothetical protein